MKHVKRYSPKLFCAIIGILFLFSTSKAQIPAKCFEIESILVDACNATSLEPNNEMVRFRVGPNPISISSISIAGKGGTGAYVLAAWPTTTLGWFGLIQNATTASLTASLQSTVVASCGRLLEPPGGVIPVGANVLMIASTNVSTVDNSFSTLTDTLYIVYHNAIYTTTAGHFRNYSAVSSTRSLVLRNTATGCNDTAIYDISLLTNISGGNGDRVDYSWPGVATYLNKGCNAPFVPITSDVGVASAAACVGAPLSLTGSATGDYSEVIWQTGGSGIFSSPTSLTTNYTPSVAGTYPISFGVVTPCNDTIFSTLSLTVNPAPVAAITASGSTTICTGSSVTLAATGGSTYSWNTGGITAAIPVSTAGTYVVTATNSCGSDTASQTIFVTLLPAVTLNNSGTTNLCSGDSLILWATGTGSYLWSTGSTNDSIIVTTGGSYSVTASNSCGSSNSSTTINSVSPPSTSIAASGSSTICAGDSISLTASGGISYSWNTGATTASISASAAGTYIVTATNSCGSNTASQTISVTPIPSVTLNNSGTTNLCTGSSVILWATGAGSYLWSTGATNDSIIVTTGGIYSVTASNSCGSESSSITITNSPLPSPIITAGGSTTICPGDSITLTASGGTTYFWNTGATSSAINVLVAGTYTVTATNACGSASISQAVFISSSPSVTINTSGSTSFCTGSNLLLWATGSGGYVWTGGSTNDTITVSAAGSYVVNSSSSCGTAYDTINISLLPLPNALITASGSTVICAGSSVILNGSGGTSYMWQPTSVSTDSISITSAGTYTLSASNSCGTDTATITVTTINLPIVGLSPNGITTICLGDNITLNASGASTFLWSTGVTGNSINVTNSGTYYVVVSNSCGADTAYVNIITESVTAFFTSDVISGNGPLAVNFTNGSSSSSIAYSWSFGDGNSSASFSPTNIYQNPGVYNVALTVTNANGCSDTYTIQITVLEDPSIINIPNVFSPNNDGQNDLFIVTSIGIKEFDCAIYDRWGLKMTDFSSVETGWDGRTDAGAKASDGTYFYVIKAIGFDNKIYDKTGYILLTR